MTFSTLIQMNKRLLRNSSLALIQKIVALVSVVIYMAMALVFLPSLTVGLNTFLLLNLAYEITKSKGNQLVDITHFTVFPVSLPKKLWWLFLSDLLSPKGVMSVIWIALCCVFTSYADTYFILFSLFLFVGYNAIALVIAFETVRIKGFTFFNMFLIMGCNFIVAPAIQHFGIHPFDAYIEQHQVMLLLLLSSIVILLIFGTWLYFKVRLPSNPFYSEYIKDTYNTDFWH